MTAIDKSIASEVHRALIEGWAWAKCSREMSKGVAPSQEEVDFLFNVGERFRETYLHEGE